MAEETKKGDGTITHEEIIRPLPKRDDVFAALADAKAGRERWEEQFGDSNEVADRPCPLR